MSESMGIPVVDLADLATPGPARDAADAALLAGLADFGLVHFRGHGIDDAALDAFYRDFIAVTARPVEEKRTWGGADLWYQRGWTPPDTEQAVVAGGQPDFKECYFMAPIPLDAEMVTEFPEVYAENVWPADASDFRKRYEEIGVQTHELGLLLLQACARALGLAEDTFTAYTQGGPHVTRALRYLPLKPAQVGTGIVWGEEHTDFNLLTLLPGGRFYDPAGAPCGRPDAGSGLYLRTRPTTEHPGGRRVYGVPPAGCMVAQVGQQLEILTGGRLLATPHEITAPAQPGYTRTSMAHFVHAHPLTLLRPLAPFRTPESIDAYRPPVLAGTYGTKTLVDIGLAPADAIHALGYRHYGRLADARRAEGRLPGMG